MDDISILDERGSKPYRRAPLAPFGNGKLRVAYILLGGLITFGASVASAQWVASMESKRTRDEAMQQSVKAIAVAEERQKNQYNEVIRLIEQLREDLREVRIRR